MDKADRNVHPNGRAMNLRILRINPTISYKLEFCLSDCRKFTRSKRNLRPRLQKISVAEHPMDCSRALFFATTAGGFFWKRQKATESRTEVNSFNQTKFMN